MCEESTVVLLRVQHRISQPRKSSIFPSHLSKFFFRPSYLFWNPGKPSVIRTHDCIVDSLGLML